MNTSSVRMENDLRVAKVPLFAGFVMSRRISSQPSVIQKVGVSDPRSSNAKNVS